MLLLIYSCSSEKVDGTYQISLVNNLTLEQGGLKSLTIQVQQFKDGQIDIAYYAVDTESIEYSQNWENVLIDKDGIITETLSNSKLFFISGKFSKGKCDLKVLEETKSEGYHIIGEKK
jgi:hypothetical protein